MSKKKAALAEVKTDRVTTEGDDLLFEVRGEGQPLLMIPGGGGDGRVYALVADILSDEYKVITYDRRANARSSGNEPRNFEISQQSRDAVAVLRAAGESSAFVFGNSSGAVIALDMAKAHPQAVKAAVIHEAPVVRVLPDSRKGLRYFAGLHRNAYRAGAILSSLKFLLLLGLPVVNAMRKADIPYEDRERMLETNRFFMQQELIPVTTYMPDIKLIKQSGVKMFSAAGIWTLEKKKVYGRTAPILAKMLGCEMVEFPGHHGSYMDMPEEWAATLRGILHKSE
jgi:pimeloyl-ACP methyl ester carboxylesterase